MCDPVSLGIATISLSAGSSIANYIGQKNQTDLLNAQNKQFYAANKQAAIDAAMVNESELGLRQSQDLLTAAAEKSDITKQETAHTSTAVVSAAEAGVSGNSLDAILNDIQSKAGENKTRIDQNTKMQLDQIQAEKSGVLVEAQNNINTVRQTTIRQPSLITPILSTGATALNVYDQYQQRQANANSGGSSNGR